jgi:hypothetical protein
VTRSLEGSTMLERHLAAGRAHRLDDGTVLVRALAPDVALLHAPCADAAGNVVLTPPYGDGVAGVMASRRGVIVTCERVISVEETRRLAHLVRLPRDAVLAVCEAPLGAHPAGLWAPSVPGVQSYAEDYPFVEEIRAASRGDLDAWYDERVAGGHDAYVAGLPVEELRRRASGAPVAPPPPLDGPATAAERAIVEAARVVRSRCEPSPWARGSCR